MHTLRDLEDGGVWIHHNSDWSGDACVHWRDTIGGPLHQWRPLAQALVHGFSGITTPSMRNADEAFRDADGQMVPRWVVARAVALAAWARITSEFVQLAERISP